MLNNLRRMRQELGLSQAELAAAARLSRQLVAAVETGRHAPSVTAALALAGALGTSVEDLFGPSPRDQAPILARPPADGALVVGAMVGESLCFAPLQDRGAGSGAWERADGVYTGGRVALFPEVGAAGLAVAGCDPALGLAAALLPATGPQRLVAVQASSGRATEALDGGRLHATIVHGPPGGLHASEEPAMRWIVARWEVGLAARPGGGIAIGEIASGRVRVARRDAGAQAQQALERTLARASRRPRVTGPLAAGHLDAARRVVFGAADVAVTMRAASLAYGLSFTPLEEHVAELRVARRWMDHPGAQALVELISSQRFRARLASLGGYDTSESGTMIVA